MIGQRAAGAGWVVVMAISGIAINAWGTEPESGVRPAYCAGNWYPADSTALASEVDDLLARAAPAALANRPVALIAPHAGYRFSAPTAAAGYKSLQAYAFKRVIVLAFSHRNAGTYAGVDVPRELTAYRTPLGDVPIDRAACDSLLSRPGFAAHPGVDRDEHSLELQLPFLQRLFPDFKLVPLLVGRMKETDYTTAARAILPLVDVNTLLVASSDCTHFGPNFGYEPFQDNVPDKLRELADAAAAPLLMCDFDGFAEHLARTQDTICGRGPISLLLRILAMQGGAAGVRAGFETSGHLTGDWTHSVTYQSIVFTRPPSTLTQPEQSELLRLARRTVTAFLQGVDPPKPAPDSVPAALRADGACFVTLENKGQLRGCIGNMEALGPLYQAVIRNATLACQDSRFVANPVTAKELDQLHLEISYLTPMKRVTKPDEIVVGRHGLLIGLGGNRGVLLPQVAYERGWSRTEFLGETCRKAGLPLEAWKRSEAEIFSFTAEVFGE